MLQNRTVRILAIAAGTLCVGVAVLSVLLFILRANGSDLRATMQVFVDTQAHEQGHLTVEASLRDSAEARSDLRTRVLHGDADTVSFLSELDQIAAEVGVRLTTEKLEVRTIEPGPFDMLDITFEVAGVERAVVNMLTLLETLPYHSHVTAVTFERLPTGSETPVRAIVTLAVSFMDT